MVKKNSSWWSRHWDEVMLGVLVIGGVILMLFSIGVIG